MSQIDSQPITSQTFYSPRSTTDFSSRVFDRTTVEESFPAAERILCFLVPEPTGTVDDRLGLLLDTTLPKSGRHLQFEFLQFGRGFGDPYALVIFGGGCTLHAASIAHAPTTDLVCEASTGLFRRKNRQIITPDRPLQSPVQGINRLFCPTANLR